MPECLPSFRLFQRPPGAGGLHPTINIATLSLFVLRAVQPGVSGAEKESPSTRTTTTPTASLPDTHYVLGAKRGPSFVDVSGSEGGLTPGGVDFLSQ